MGTKTRGSETEPVTLCPKVAQVQQRLKLTSTGSTVVSGLFDAGLSKAIPVTVESNRARLRTDRQH